MQAQSLPQSVSAGGSLARILSQQLPLGGSVCGQGEAPSPRSANHRCAGGVMKLKRSCKILGCMNRYHSRGFCQCHHDKERRAGRLSTLITHGMRHTPEYKAWQAMKQRCTNPKGVGWIYYGARGIQVCENWREDFSAFFACVGPRPSRRHSLDSYPDNNGNYAPGNVRWATPSQRSENRRRSLRCSLRTSPPPDH